MTAARLQRIEETFHAALECEPDQLDALLDARCDGDEPLRTKVKELLASRRQVETSIETSIAVVAAHVLESERGSSLIGQTIGHYQISERVGGGGMGEVYVARDIITGRKAALKFLPAQLTTDVARLKRFDQEAHVLAALNHPNILTVYEVSSNDRTRYIATELIEGETLRQRLARGHVQLGEAIEIVIQVAGALAAAHQAGIIHRDVKPENIMLRPDGYVKVLDFGIAKLSEEDIPGTATEEEAIRLVETNVGAVIGTVSYMSPEQARGANVDKRTDIWSLGVVLYELAAGRAPFIGDTPRGVMAAVFAAGPPPLSSYIAHVPRQLQEIVTKALRKTPNERYQNASEMLDALKGLRRKLELTAESERFATKHPWLRRMRSPAAATLALLAGALVVALPFFRSREAKKSSMPERSIAVLPFQNLSPDKENTYFADGIQNEILSDLARVADLKVISRTSVMHYESGTARNLREIGKELGVTHVLEGSVARLGNRFRINAQLIDARTDRHLWGQAYERELSDVFVTQNEIATTIAEQLRAKLSSAEKDAIEHPPTNDLTAFDLYTRAKNLVLSVSFTNMAKPNLLEAADLLNQALAYDPGYFQAYCELAFIHDYLYLSGIDRTPARLTLAEAAVKAAFHLRPDAGEAHLAHAGHLYRGYLDYGGALTELEVARHSLPNDSRLFELSAYIKRRQGKQEEALRDLHHAIELDPRNLYIMQQAALSCHFLRRYADEEAMLSRILAIEPNDAQTKAVRAFLELDWKANTEPLHQTIDSIRSTTPAALPTVAEMWLNCALAERDAAAAKDALIASGENSINLGQFGDVLFSREFIEGVIARMMNNDDKARLAFTTARAAQEKVVQAQPNFGPALCVLGLIDASLGRKKDALREGRRAVELLPLEKDAYRGSSMLRYQAMIAAWVGEKDLACQELAAAARYPGSLSYGDLRLFPFWDPLRADPRFEKIVASLAPK